MGVDRPLEAGKGGIIVGPPAEDEEGIPGIPAGRLMLLFGRFGVLRSLEPAPSLLSALLRRMIFALGSTTIGEAARGTDPDRDGCCW